MDIHTKTTQINEEKISLKKRPEIYKALEEIATKKGESLKIGFTQADKIWLLAFLTAILVSGLIRYFIPAITDLQLYLNKYNIPTIRILNSMMAIFIVLSIAVLLNRLVISKIDDSPTRYNIERLFNLIVVLLLTFIVISAIFINWYTAAISLGIISLILGFALQNPLTSFFAWIYILIRKPFEVGDRIAIGNASGDVIDLGYFDTTLWEFGGQYMSGDHPSGRIIRFPNSKIFDEYVYNYSWPLFPYLWNEIKFYIAYDSDLAFIEKVVGKIVEEEIGDEMLNRIESYHSLLRETPVEALNVKDKPAVFFRTSENTWVEVVVRYLVEPKESGSVKSRLVKKILEELNRNQDIVKFPNGNSR